MTTDWWQIITQLQQSGLPLLRIGRAMGDVSLTNKMLVHYRSGTEPLHWRGQMLLVFWAETTGQRIEDRPMREQVRGRYRAIGTGVRPSHETQQPGYDGPLRQLAQAMCPAAADTGPAPPPAPERKKPGPKPGMRRVAMGAT